LSEERRAIDSFKKVVLMVLGLAMQTYGVKLSDQQEVLTYLSDIVIDVFSAESALLRAQAAAGDTVQGAALHADAARVFVNDASMRIESAARQALAAMLEGDELRTALSALRRLFRQPPINTVRLRQRLADESVRLGRYIF
jgi:hypothetical protein